VGGRFLRGGATAPNAAAICRSARAAGAEEELGSRQTLYAGASGQRCNAAWSGEAAGAADARAAPRAQLKKWELEPG